MNGAIENAADGQRHIVPRERIRSPIGNARR
jgi:hypothetical protein